MIRVQSKQFNASSVLDAPLRDIAELYCGIWREPPWNEMFWEADSVIEDILSEMSKPFSCLIYAEIESEVVGFAWGYQITYKNMQEIASLKGFSPIMSHFRQRVGYIDELGVSSKWRGLGIGSRLNSLLINAMYNYGMQRIILRTSETAIPARNLYAKADFSELNIRDGKHSDRTYWLK